MAILIVYLTLKDLVLLFAFIHLFNIVLLYWVIPFFYKQFIFDPRPEYCLGFSKKLLQKIV